MLIFQLVPISRYIITWYLNSYLQTIYSRAENATCKMKSCRQILLQCIQRDNLLKNKFTMRIYKYSLAECNTMKNGVKMYSSFFNLSKLLLLDKKNTYTIVNYWKERQLILKCSAYGLHWHFLSGYHSGRISLKYLDKSSLDNNIYFPHWSVVPQILVDTDTNSEARF